MSVLTDLRALREDMAEAERRVADWILAHPEEAQLSSVRALAGKCETSVATIVRLAQRLGCSGFPDFKIRLAQQMTPGVSAMFEAVEDSDSTSDLVSKVFGGNSHSLDETLKMLDTEEFDSVARRIAHCRRCFIYGFGSSAYVAQDTALRFAHLGLQADAYPGVLETAISAMHAGSHDVAIGISHSGRSLTTVNSLAAARERGALTVGISNYPNSPLSEVSDVFFCLAFPESRVRAAALSSRVSQVCLIDALYLLVARHMESVTPPDAIDDVVEGQFRISTRKRRKS